MASKVDTSDPQVRKMVYNMYRGILGNYNSKANDIVDALPKERVQQDQGVSKQLESMIRQSHQISGGNAANSSPGGEIGGCGPPPPPPPLQGSVPSVRIKSEIPQGKKPYEPPAAIQNAMMTKDKKPFTYTPGGLDLAEIKSPRMARRINRNAHMEDSCTPAQDRVAQQMSQHPHQPLPPSALAAMQPQIAIPVFPPGSAPTLGGHHHYQQQQPPQHMPPPPSMPAQTTPQPPPPPPPTSGSAPPPPPPPPPASSNNSAGVSHLTPSSHENNNSNNLQNGQISGRSPPPFLQDIQNRPQLRPVGLPNTQPKPSAVTEQPMTAPLKPVAQPFKTIQETSPAAPPINIQLKTTAPRPPSENFPPPPPPLCTVVPDSRPIQNVRPVVQSSPNQLPFHKLDIQAAQAQAQVQAPPPVSSLSTPKQTPPSSGNLNKSPAPWMTTRQASKESPPAWAVRQPTFDEATPQSPQSPQYSTRVVPIQIEGRDSPKSPEPPRQQPPPPPHQHQSRPIQPQYTPPPQQQPPYIPVFQAPQYYTTLPTQPVQPRQQPPPPQQFQQQSADSPRTRIIPIQIEGAQQSVDPRTLQSQTSWTQSGGNPIQSRSFRVLQKITGSDEDSIASTPVGADGNTMWWPPPSPTTPPPYQPLSPMYWPPPTPPSPQGSGPPLTPEEQQKFWEHYNAMCSYVMQMNATAAAYCYSPYTVTPPPPAGPYLRPPPPLYPSDSEDCSGYSSSDEMTYYGKIFKQQALLAKQFSENNQPPPLPLSSSSSSSEPNKLQSIKSVPDIRIYKDSDDSESVTESETDEDDDDVEDRAGSDTESDIPHTLSVIFEDTEPSTSETKTESFDESDDDGDSTTSTLNNEEEEEENETAQNDTTVTVRLPLQLSFNRSKDSDEITVVVGAEEVEEEADKNDFLVITDIVREDSDPDVSATICIKKRVKKVEESTGGEGADSPIDFWKELSKDGEGRANETPNSDDNDGHWEDDSSSTSIQTIKKGQSEGETCSGSELEATVEKTDEDEVRSTEVDSKSEDSSDETDDSSVTDSSSDEEEEEEEENNEKESPKEGTNTEKQEESDEEDDSGVTSDLSRHISETDTDAECGGELGKMTKYQRTATHSRLFKLLQDECNNDDDDDDAPASTQCEDLTARKERLTLPLVNHHNGEQESLSSSSGVNSPTSPTVTDRLVKELVQSLLSRKKGRHFRKLPLEKLHAAALRILQEDMDPYDTSSTSDEGSFFMSPVDVAPRKKIENNHQHQLPLPNPPEAYGGNYQDYCKYYSSWAADATDDYDIVPSKAFKILQDSSPLKIVPVRCPRVPEKPPPPPLLPVDPLNSEATIKNPEET